jgi:hypothetical protein
MLLTMHSSISTGSGLAGGVAKVNIKMALSNIGCILDFVL